MAEVKLSEDFLILSVVIILCVVDIVMMASTSLFTRFLSITVQVCADNAALLFPSVMDVAASLLSFN